MKLVLLPGMDGTGELFAPALAGLGDIDTDVISLPQGGAQDYDALAHYVFGRLPDEPFVLVAESFSGGIATVLSRMPIANLQGIIFVASFLSAPAPVMARIARWLPIGFLVGLPLSRVMFRLLFVGGNAEDELVSLLRGVIQRVPAGVLRQRLRVIAAMRPPNEQCAVPVVCIVPRGDRLIGRGQRRCFERSFSDITFIEVDGPHFILQARPEQSARALKQGLNDLLSRRATTDHADTIC